MKKALIIIIMLVFSFVYADSWRIDRVYKTREAAIESANCFLIQGWEVVKITKFSNMNEYEVSAWRSN